MLEVVKRVCASWPGTALSALSLGQFTVSASWVIRHAVDPEAQGMSAPDMFHLRSGSETL